MVGWLAGCVGIFLFLFSFFFLPELGKYFYVRTLTNFEILSPFHAGFNNLESKILLKNDYEYTYMYTRHNTAVYRNIFLLIFHFISFFFFFYLVEGKSYLPLLRISNKKRENKQQQKNTREE